MNYYYYYYKRSLITINLINCIQFISLTVVSLKRKENIYGIRGFVGQLCGERRHVRERWSASEWQGAAVFAEGLSGAVASGLGKVRYLN